MAAAVKPTEGLLEREHELAELRLAVVGLQRGEGRALLVEGAPGSGKTALLGELRSLAVVAGSAVLADRADGLDAAVPFGVARRLVASRAEDPSVARVVERLEHAHVSVAASVEEGAAIAEELAAAIERVARREPLVVIVDDAQWADAATAGLLALLMDRARAMPAVVAVALRAGELDRAELASLRLLPGVTRLELAELGAGGVRALVRRQLPTADESFVAACRKVTGGNPFLLGELVTEFTAGGSEADAGAAARIEVLVPETVIDGVLVRMGRLPGAAAALARAVAVLGDRVPLRHAVALAELDPAEACTAADALVTVSIFTPSELLSFRHPLLAAAVLADIGAFRRAELHRRAAQLLLAEGALEQASAHLLHSTPLGDGEVVDHLRRAAGVSLGRGDPRTAAAFLGRALDEPPGAEERPALLVELAKAEAAYGAPSAVDRLEEALDLIADAGERAEVLRQLARLHYLRAQFGLAARLAGRAMDELDVGDPRRERARATWQMAAGLNPDTHPVAMAEENRLVDAHGEGRGPRDPELMAVVAVVLASRFGDPGDAAQLAAAAIEAMLDDREVGPELAMSFAATALFLAGDLERLERLAGRAHDRAVDDGSLLATAVAAIWRGMARLRLGDIDGAEADAAKALLPERHGWHVYTPHAAALLASVRLERADVAGARAAVELARGVGIPHPPHRIAEGQVLLAEGDAPAALAAFLDAGRVHRELWQVDSPVGMHWRSAAAIAAVAAGDRPAAETLAGEELGLARRAGVPVTIAIALRARALAHGGEREVGLLREALAMLEQTGELLETIRTRVQLGAALRRHGERRAARAELALARDQAERIGAGALAERASEEQRASGARPRRTQVWGPESLTPSERRIAERAASGATNKQIAAELFLAPKTVEWHIANVFRKLDVTRRRDLESALRGGAS